MTSAHGSIYEAKFEFTSVVSITVHLLVYLSVQEIKFLLSKFLVWGLPKGHRTRKIVQRYDFCHYSNHGN